MEASFISFHDLSPEGRYLYASPSITSVNGFAPSDVVGTPAYDYFFASELEACHELHRQTIAFEKVAVVVHLHMRTRWGQYIKVATVSNLCTDCIVSCTWRITDDEKARARDSASEEAWVVEANGRIVSKCWNLRDHYFSSHRRTWDENVADIKQVRACLILNRFTAKLDILFCTANIARLLPGVTPQAFMQTSLIDLVHPTCRHNVLAEVARVKRTEGMCHVRFTLVMITVDGESKEFDMEMVIAGTSDGLIGIMRACSATHVVAAADRPAAVMGAAAPSTSSRASTASTPSAPSVASSVDGGAAARQPPGLMLFTKAPVYLDFGEQWTTESNRLSPASDDVDSVSDSGMDDDEDDEEVDEDDMTSVVTSVAGTYQGSDQDPRYGGAALGRPYLFGDPYAHGHAHAPPHGHGHGHGHVPHHAPVHVAYAGGYAGHPPLPPPQHVHAAAGYYTPPAVSAHPMAYVPAAPPPPLPHSSAPPGPYGGWVTDSTTRMSSRPPAVPSPSWSTHAARHDSVDGTARSHAAATVATSDYGDQDDVFAATWTGLPAARGAGQPPRAMPPDPGAWQQQPGPSGWTGSGQ
ncbi:hypothetical protein AMAG_04373 [Allomyces macrogynus ATCC 38327]|uniref:PAS domain-containing protein n=1 Tax=Allomyces macrogynus (strain ATCC 38327) TaxID=578462 RepID=A0A0L0S8A4_ALLM3|nr:hypothetical protein AMAG_04373 [Allomyces macrogynus ATCC 38327]|eukprot:KNE58828.1 hypothetical protein AMAG_04373 [Allomyces macrogynus ATCC 38327]